jgi:hypothetical protein
MTRTLIKLDDHLQGMLNALDGVVPFPVGDGYRPKDVQEQWVDPPYAVVRMFTSAEEFDGPLSDTQVDVVLRYQIVAVGLTQTQAVVVQDLCRAELVDKTNITVTGRSIMDLRLMVTSNGVFRDDDLPTPFFYCYDIWELHTTPA